MPFEFPDNPSKAVVAKAHIGADAIMFSNGNDRPYGPVSPWAIIAAISSVVSAIKPVLRVPFGANELR